MQEKEYQIYIHQILEILKHKKINFYYDRKNNNILIPPENLTESLLYVYLYQEEFIDMLRKDVFFKGENISNLEQQIEKMKCCGNCKHNIKPTTKESNLFCCECKKLDETKDNIILTKWEFDKWKKKKNSFIKI